MEKITLDEFNKMEGKKKFSPIRETLEKLEVNEGLLIKNEEWFVKSYPGAYIPQSFRQSRSSKMFSVKTLANKSGWAVLRIK